MQLLFVFQTCRKMYLLQNHSFQLWKAGKKSLFLRTNIFKRPGVCLLFSNTNPFFSIPLAKFADFVSEFLQVEKNKWIRTDCLLGKFLEVGLSREPQNGLSFRGYCLYPARVQSTQQIATKSDFLNIQRTFICYPQDSIYRGGFR